jgi:hypothetical protein
LNSSKLVEISSFYPFKNFNIYSSFQEHFKESGEGEESDNADKSAVRSAPPGGRYVPPGARAGATAAGERTGITMGIRKM